MLAYQCLHAFFFFGGQNLSPPYQMFLSATWQHGLASITKVYYKVVMFDIIKTFIEFPQSATIYFKLTCHWPQRLYTFFFSFQMTWVSTQRRSPSTGCGGCLQLQWTTNPLCWQRRASAWKVERRNSKKTKFEEQKQQLDVVMLCWGESGPRGPSRRKN